MSGVDDGWAGVWWVMLSLIVYWL